MQFMHQAHVIFSLSAKVSSVATVASWSRTLLWGYPRGPPLNPPEEPPTPLNTLLQTIIQQKGEQVTEV